MVNLEKIYQVSYDAIVPLSVGTMIRGCALRCYSYATGFIAAIEPTALTHVQTAITLLDPVL